MRIQIRFEAEVKSIKAKMDSISGVYDDLNEKMHDVDKTMWVIHFFRLQMPWNTWLVPRVRVFVTALEDWWWFALAAKTTFCSTEWFRTRSQNFQTRSARGYFFLRFTSHNNIYSMSIWFVNINPLIFSGARSFPLQPRHHPSASLEEGALPKNPNSVSIELLLI